MPFEYHWKELTDKGKLKEPYDNHTVGYITPTFGYPTEEAAVEAYEE